MALYGDRNKRKRYTDIPYEHPHRVVRQCGALAVHQVRLRSPAFLDSEPLFGHVMLSSTNRLRWKPAVPSQFLKDNKHWAASIARLACVCACWDVVRTEDVCTIDPDSLRKSRVMGWVARIRELMQQRDSGDLPNPVVVAPTRRAGKRRRRGEVLYDGARITDITMDRLVNKFKHMIASASRAGGVFPYLNHTDTQSRAIECYKLCILHSSTPGFGSDNQVLLACLIEACCPHLFPDTPSNDSTAAETMAAAAARILHGRQDYDRLARKFTDES
uniref:Uncharacterized protein n=1 Tax=viral metagenome TaxID=1070528 RepID=A0A6C0KDE4_9ZZZZ